MRMLQSILLAVECRHVDDAAVDAAVRLARTFGSKLTLLHVVEATHPAVELYRIQDAESFLRKLESRLAEVSVVRFRGENWEPRPRRSSTSRRK
jgi:nucleotide-binding universal stress UspA family protein